MCGCAVTKNDSERIDYVKLILAKTELNIKRFMFKNVCKSRLNNKLEATNEL